MEPADQAQLHSKLGQQGTIWESQQQQLQHMQTLTHQMADLNTSFRTVATRLGCLGTIRSSDDTSPPGLVAAAAPLVDPIASFHKPPTSSGEVQW